MADAPRHAAARPRFVLRRMTPRDLAAVRRLERDAYGAASPQTDFAQELASDLAEHLVAVEQPPAADPAAAEAQPARRPLRRLLGRRDGPAERVVGFAGFWFTQDQLHLVTIAVDPAYQRRGIAQRLLLEGFALARGAGQRTVALEVRPSNTAAIRLYERFGFHRTGVRAHYYADNNEDALVMITPDLDDPALRERIERLRDDHQRRYGAAFTVESPADAAR